MHDQEAAKYLAAINIHYPPGELLVKSLDFKQFSLLFSETGIIKMPMLQVFVRIQ